MAGPGCFLHCDQSILDIKTSHISRWIIEMIKLAYQLIPNAELMKKVTAHEVRALSDSWAYASSISFDDIKAALFWKSSGVFQNHYLRDMSTVAPQLRQFSHLVVAGQVVPATS